MELLLSVVIGVLYAAALYLLMRRSIVKLIMGLILLSHAGHLLIFASGGLTRGGVPLIPEGSLIPVYPLPDPLTQAMILTAIVISFGVLAFVLVLTFRNYDMTGTDDVDKLKTTDT